MNEYTPLTIENVDDRWANELQGIVNEARELLPRIIALAAHAKDYTERFDREHIDVIDPDEYPMDAPTRHADCVLGALAEPLKSPGGEMFVANPADELEQLNERLSGTGRNVPTTDA